MTARRIAVVDDDDAMVESLCDILELHGWAPVRARDGEEAVRVASGGEIPVVLMDIRMPRKNGVDAMLEIKRRAPDTQVLLVTASASEELMRRAEAGGVARILRKPVNVPLLLALLDGMLPA